MKRIMMLDSIKGSEPYQRMKERAQDRQGWSDCQIFMKPAEQQYTTERDYSFDEYHNDFTSVDFTPPMPSLWYANKIAYTVKTKVLK